MSQFSVQGFNNLFYDPAFKQSTRHGSNHKLAVCQPNLICCVRLGHWKTHDLWTETWIDFGNTCLISLSCSNQPYIPKGLGCGFSFMSLLLGNSIYNWVFYTDCAPKDTHFSSLWLYWSFTWWSVCLNVLRYLVVLVF